MIPTLNINNYIKSSAYQTEADLIETVMLNLAVFLPHQDTPHVAVREHVVGAGKVDIVLANALPDLLAKRMQTTPDQTSDVRNVNALVLSQLHFRKALTISTISRRCGLSADAIMEIIHHLVVTGLCSECRNLTFVRTNLSKQFTDIIAIEGKLQNWRAALRQAYRNRLFSNFTYVVLDAKHARPAISNKNEFASSGVGLAVANADSNTVTIVQKPTSHRPISNVMHVIAQETITESVKQSKAHLSKDLTNALYHN